MSKELQTSGGNEPSGAERRTAERHPCNLQPLWTEWGSGRGESPLAQVRNISAGGISLVTPCRLRPGTVLLVRLQSTHKGISRPLLARVIHSTQAPDGLWISGSSFVRRLSLEELGMILSESEDEAITVDGAEFIAD